ncbi:hypothetical protein LJC06_03750 [Bacteroidales bacterium OttesenSCG-928-I14]|nr:hypothetical protein [Bacteroidales bacterium OttesenSCG-928-I14]
MKQSLCLFFILFCFNIVFGKDESKSPIHIWDEALTAEQNIAKNALLLDSNNEFSFLDEIVQDKKLVLLGEKGHWDLTTMEVKIKMIDYLSKKGIKTLAIEGVSFLPTYIYYNPEYREATKNLSLSFLWQMPISGHPIFR